ncbi:thioredoxin-like protein [Polychytrium aggregatum]|uniref:thioredoxin-like protein n=1 Tax=Polychytrium aggregatum TaxID=110093 RepID=UPI0022FE58A2|nr:thioredoxin-like protein [Polychytrium aggregatum]KAI9199354.1 thioredoxin-like protein [Polychytrium aggregatum]
MIENLSDHQKQVLGEFQSLTGIQDPNEAATLLEGNNWRIEGLLDFSEPNDSPSEANAQTSSRSSPQRDRGQWSLFGVVTAPIKYGFQLLYSVTVFIVSLFSFLLSFLYPGTPGRLGSSRRAAPNNNDPQAASARFLLNFEQKYGSVHPPFFQGTYTQALETAKRELRYLLVLLHSEEHDDTEAFNRQVLSSDVMTEFLTSRRFIFWAGDIRESEAFQVSNVLSATTYPFLALIALQGTQMVVVDRVEGLTTSDEIIRILERHLGRLDAQLAAARMERERREQSRSIRAHQDSAYEASLRADREKEQRAREERERQRRELEEQEREARRKQEMIEEKRRRIQTLRENFPSEPEGSGRDVAKISMRLPNGERLIRRFLPTDKVQLLYDFVSIQNLEPIPEDSTFIIASTFPRRVLEDMDMTLAEAQLTPNGSVAVEEK